LRIPLSATTTRSRGRGDELELRAPVDREGAEVAGVQPDHRRAERGRARQLLASCASTSVSRPSFAGDREELGLSRRRGREEKEHGVCAARLRRLEVLPRREESLGEEGSEAPPARPRRSSHVPAKRSSTRTETAEAPARSNAAASSAGSASGRRSPADGERRFTSAMAPSPG
jgi:hypothetical protein